MRSSGLICGLILAVVCSLGTAPAPGAAAEAPAPTSRQGPLDPGSLRDLLGREVKSIEGSRIGKIRDVVVLEGNRTSLVLSIGGFLGMGSKQVTLPYEALLIGSEELRVNMTEREVGEQPIYDPEEAGGVSLRRGDQSQ